MHKLLTFLVFISLSVNSFAKGFITQNIANGCNVGELWAANNESNLLAVWQPNSYTCAPGYFLPANAIECVKCTVDHTCNGGTYVFNENISQGIMLNQIITTDFVDGCATDIFNNSNMTAVWQINSYDCNTGYYLPADGVECELCPADNYCPGGKYTYSENITQGAMECPSGLVAPMGSVDAGSCGRRFHIGNEVVYLRSQKKTTPSLNFDTNGDGVPDFFLNATATRTRINNTSTHYLHADEYYLYDDTITPVE